GLRWLPADRVSDGAWMAFVLAAGLGLGHALPGGHDDTTRGRISSAARPAASVAVVLALVLVSLPAGTLTLWPHAGAWPVYGPTVRGLRLDDLWRTLRTVPDGRVLFVRSGLPLVYGTEWWRAHTHVTALTPIESGRPIVNGTFTHPSPVAAVVYRGDAGHGAITRLVERLDGEMLFGRPLDHLDAATFNRYADALGVAAVVALDDDRPRLSALEDNPVFARAPVSPPFVLYRKSAGIRLPQRIAPGRWRIDLEGTPGGWAPAGIAFYPLWRAEAQGRALPVRRGDLAQLEVRLPGGRASVDLVYEPGLAERGGTLVSVLGAAATLALARRGRHRRSPPA
ncbi:MAG: hypothetical protein ACREJG_00045, partial [Candidatus Rokuibacteriota bacterium]